MTDLMFTEARNIDMTQPSPPYKCHDCPVLAKLNEIEAAKSPESKPKKDRDATKRVPRFEADNGEGE